MLTRSEYPQKRERNFPRGRAADVGKPADLSHPRDPDRRSENQAREENAFLSFKYSTTSRL